MILVNFIPSSEVVRTRWWVYDLALAVTLLTGGFVLTAYMLGANYSQVDAIYQRSKNLERDLSEKSGVLALIETKNRQLSSLGLASEQIFAEDADKKTKSELPFVTYQLLTKLPADMWFTGLTAERKTKGQRHWQLTGESLSYGSIAKFLGALANDRGLKKGLQGSRLVIGQLRLAELEQRKGSAQPIRFTITLTTKDSRSRYAKSQADKPTDHRL